MDKIDTQVLAVFKLLGRVIKAWCLQCPTCPTMSLNWSWCPTMSLNVLNFGENVLHLSYNIQISCIQIFIVDFRILPVQFSFMNHVCRDRPNAKVSYIVLYYLKFGWNILQLSYNLLKLSPTKCQKMSCIVLKCPTIRF